MNCKYIGGHGSIVNAFYTRMSLDRESLFPGADNGMHVSMVSPLCNRKDGEIGNRFTTIVSLSRNHELIDTRTALKSETQPLTFRSES